MDTSIPSSVVLDEFDEFVRVDGEYRIYDIKVYNRETGEYEPLELTKTYTIGASNYILLERGSGLKMLENVKIIQNDGVLDVEAMERYITEVIGGTVGSEFAEAAVNITFTEGKPVDEPENNEPENEEQKPEVEETPETGDTAGVTVILLVMLGASLLTMTKTATAKKR